MNHQMFFKCLTLLFLIKFAVSENVQKSGDALNPQSLIVNGEDAAPNEFPWQVRIRLDQKTRPAPSYEHNQCGGSLIAKNLVLTAAHCCTKAPNGSEATYMPEQLKIITGEHDTRRAEYTKRTHSVKKIFIHKSYQRIGVLNDVCLIWMKSDIKCTLEVSPISLPLYNPILSRISRTPPDAKHIKWTTLNGLECYATGWGYKGMRPDGRWTRAHVLQKMKVPTLYAGKHPLCWKKNESLRDGQICLHGWCHNRGICKGDSGGPIVCKISGKLYDHWELLGVSSWLDDATCGQKGPYFSMAADVAYYVPWIWETLKSEKRLYSLFLNSYMECGPLWSEYACVEECQTLKGLEWVKTHNSTLNCVKICQCQDFFGVEPKDSECYFAKPGTV